MINVVLGDKLVHRLDAALVDLRKSFVFKRHDGSSLSQQRGVSGAVGSWTNDLRWISVGRNASYLIAREGGKRQRTPIVRNSPDVLSFSPFRHRISVASSALHSVRPGRFVGSGR